MYMRASVEDIYSNSYVSLQVKIIENVTKIEMRMVL
jgi:hypothetical protein